MHSKTESTTLRLSIAENHALSYRADELGVSRSMVIRMLINEFIIGKPLRVVDEDKLQEFVGRE